MNMEFSPETLTKDTERSPQEEGGDLQLESSANEDHHPDKTFKEGDLERESKRENGHAFLAGKQEELSAISHTASLAELDLRSESLKAELTQILGNGEKDLTYFLILGKLAAVREQISDQRVGEDHTRPSGEHVSKRTHTA